MKKAVVILSGGMDSTTLLYDVIKQGYETYALSFNYNQKHKKELKCAKKTCEKLNIHHKLVELNTLNDLAPSSLTRDDWDIPEGHYADENMKQTVVPNRNMVLISLATSYAISLKADKLFYGAHSGDHDIYPDCRSVFVKKLAEVIKLADWHKLELEAPYLEIDKGDIAIKGKELNVDYSLTWTCYKGKEDAHRAEAIMASEKLKKVNRSLYDSELSDKKANIIDKIKYEKN